MGAARGEKMTRVKFTAEAEGICAITRSTQQVFACDETHWKYSSGSTEQTGRTSLRGILISLFTHSG